MAKTKSTLLNLLITFQNIMIVYRLVHGVKHVLLGNTDYLPKKLLCLLTLNLNLMWKRRRNQISLAKLVQRMPYVNMATSRQSQTTGALQSMVMSKCFCVQEDTVAIMRILVLAINRVRTTETILSVLVAVTLLKNQSA